MAGKIAKGMRKRLFQIGVFVVAGAVLLSGWIFRQSIVRGAEARSVAEDQQTRDVVIDANRGTIYDINGNVLAQSATVWNVVLSPNDISGNADKIANSIEGDFTIEQMKDLLATGLSEILGVEEQEIRDRCEKNNYYEIVKRQIDSATKDALITWLDENDVTCVSTLETSKRSYPYNNLASTVIGFTNNDNQGAYGLEAQYNSYLSGTPGRLVASKNALGRDMPYSYEKNYEAVDGKGIVLTLDLNVQHFLEDALDNVITQHHPDNRTCGIVMNVKTGEILAMATKEDFNLNDPYTITDPDTLAQLSTLSGEEYEKARNDAWYRTWKNKAITELYEPGSVFKVVTGSAALEEKVISMDSTFNCVGRYNFNIPGVKPISCWKPAGHGTLDLTRAFVNSCNPAFITIGQRLGIDAFYRYFKAYGLTERTGIDLPSESNSYTLGYEQYGVVELASASFGQSNKITPIQMLTAFCASINDGKLMQPHVVKQLLDSEGNVEQTIEPVVKRQVISAETSAQLRQMLEAVVSVNGNGAVAGYRILGKTGTGEKLDDHNEIATKRVSSMIGAAPADDPEVAVLIMVDEPTSGQVYGSVVAAPAISEVMADLLPYLNVQKEADEDENVTHTVPNLVGTDFLTAKAKLNELGITNTAVYGDGTSVLRQMPAGGAKVGENGTVILYTGENVAEQTVTMVDLIGKTPADANRTLTNMGLNIALSGVSEGDAVTVVNQSVAVGETVPKGTVITVTCVNVGD